MKTKAKSQPHAKLLAEAAEILGGAYGLPRTAEFESACLDWLAARDPNMVLMPSAVAKAWSVVITILGIGAISFRHKLRHVALAKAVIAVSRQKGTTT